MRQMNYAEEFIRYWETQGRYLPIDNPSRTRNNILKWLEECNSIEDIDEYVCLNLKQGKERTRRIILDFYSFLEKENDFHIESALTEKRFYDDPIERQLMIARFLHKPHSIQEIEEEFGIKGETRKKDLQSLREGIEFLGSKIQIEETRQSGELKYKSTVHPIFLPLNLTEAYALTVYVPHLLRGGNPNEEILEGLVARMKSQLSDYAYTKLFPGETRISASNDYFDDEMLAHQRKGTLMYLMKSSRRCKFFWKGEEYFGKIVYEGNVYRIKLDDGTILAADPEKAGEVEFIVLDYE